MFKITKKNFSLFTITVIVCLALIFTACKPVATGVVSSSPSSSSGGSGASGSSKTVTLTLNLSGGSGIEPFIKGEENSSITPPQNPTRHGYDFKGWNPNLPGTFPANNATYMAQWQAKTYDITYNLNGGANPTDAKTVYTIADTTFSLPTPTKSGYTFAGWYENESFNGSEVKQIASGSTGKKTFWAKWEMTIDQAIAAIKALGSEKTLDVVLVSDTTQAVFDNKSSALQTSLKSCKGEVSLDMSKTGVTGIGSSAFANCTSLVSVNIPDSVTSIGDEAFSGCTSLASVNIPNGMTSIGVMTFGGCMSLASVDIPDSVTSIGDWAFYICTSLTTINYAGTKDDWNTKITSFGVDWRYIVPAEGVTCSDGKTYKFVTTFYNEGKLGDEL